MLQCCLVHGQGASVVPGFKGFRFSGSFGSTQLPPYGRGRVASGMLDKFDAHNKGLADHHPSTDR